METFKLSTGILLAGIVRYTASQVVISLRFEGNPTEFKYVNREDFDGLRNWVDSEYGIID